MAFGRCSRFRQKEPPCMVPTSRRGRIGKTGYAFNLAGPRLQVCGTVPTVETPRCFPRGKPAIPTPSLSRSEGGCMSIEDGRRLIGEDVEPSLPHCRYQMVLSPLAYSLNCRNMRKRSKSTRAAIRHANVAYATPFIGITLSGASVVIRRAICSLCTGLTWL